MLTARLPLRGCDDPASEVQPLAFDRAGDQSLLTLRSERTPARDRH